jgi:glycosyltransferase involved in cell wall biosynthesis/Tfp pilus assembly protein PilF
MKLKYLVGPVSARRAEEAWAGPRRSGACRAFNATGGLDLAVGPRDTWDDVLSRLPEGWRPDLVVLDPAYRCVPPGLWRAPVPLVALAADWNFLWHGYRRLLPLCDLVLTDSAGVEVMRRQGIYHARAANLYGPERAYLDLPEEEGERDIDVLFVGNLHPAVQRGRLPWLGRLSRLPGRKVVIRSGVFGDDYRALLRRAKIAFNRSVRGECNQRTFEAAAAGALLFQEADNREVPEFFEPGKEYVRYADNDLEALLEHYLSHEDERRAIAAAARRRVQDYGSEALWARTLARIATEWDDLCARAATRPVPGGTELLRCRVGEALSAPAGADPALVGDLTAALQAGPATAELLNDLGLALAHAGAGAAAAGRQFRAALDADGCHPVAALNLIEALADLGQRDLAAEGARRLLGLLGRGEGLDPGVLDAMHYPPGFDLFRVEWENAARAHAGNPDGEARAKVELLHWRLHELLAVFTGELSHYHEAALARPDLPVVRAALGCALGRAGRPADASRHLTRAVHENPFDAPAARALFHALFESGDGASAVGLAAERRLLRRAIPGSVPPETWFAGPAGVPLREGGPLQIIWEGPLLDRHSLGLVNRELCLQLAARGHGVTALPRDRNAPAGGVPELLRPLLRGAGQDAVGPADVHVRLEWPPRWDPPPSGHWVVVQPWEFGSLPRDWLGPLSGPVDEVWVPTWFVRDCFVASGVPADRVHVVPLGVGPERFRPGLEPFPLKTTKRFKFLFVGGTIHRKGFDLLLDAYARAFRRDDDVCLVVKDMGVGTFYRGQTAEAAVSRLRADPAAPEVEYLDVELADEDVPGLYAACDCLVHPYRGEGFGLPIAEAMACGLAVAVTGYGAALDFCDQSNAYLLPARVRRMEGRRLGDIETVTEPWRAEPDRQALREILRHIASHPDEARAKGAAAAARIRSEFTWARSVEAVEQRLWQLRQRPVRRPGAPAVLTAVRRDSSAGTANARPRVSLCLIVKNEEANLPDCLGSAADLVDEVVVVDTGSTDKTKEIAARYGARVFNFPWCDNFAAARNETLRHATGDWIFWLDADDRVDEDNRAKLRQLFAGLGDDNAAYAMKCLCLPDAVTGTSTVVDHIRLFRNRPDVRWSYRVHEQILPAVRKVGGEVRWADVVIRHTGYQDPPLRKRKLERDLRLLKLEDAERPDDPFTLFNFGQVAQELGKHAEAIPLLRRSLQRSHPKDSIVRKLYALIAGCHRQLGQKEAALAACREGKVHYPDDAELLFIESILLREKGELAGAEACLRRTLAAPGEGHFASVDAGLRGYKARQNLAVLCLQQGKNDEAEVHFREVLAERPDFLPGWLGLAELLLSQKRWAELEEAAARLAEAPGGSAEAAVLRARGLLARREFEPARALLEQVIGEAPQALAPRVVLSHVLLQEGRDPDAAERALRSVLELAPGHAEARNNLAVLRREREEARATADAVFAGNVGIAELYFSACRADHPLREHLPTLVVLARGCRHVTDVGTGIGLAAAAFLYAEPERLVCLDSVKYAEVDRLGMVAGRTDFTFRQADVFWDELEQTDLLFLDTWRVEDQLREELRLHAGKARKYIVVHGTTTFDEQGEDEGHRGLGPALAEFLAGGAFRVKERRTEGQGLTVLERVEPATSLTRPA